MVISVADALPTGPRLGPVADVDGDLVLPPFLQRDRRLHAAASTAVNDRKKRVRDMLRRRGIEHVVAASSEDVIDALIDLFRRQRRVRR